MIDLTPLDVRNKRGDFKKLMRGYDPQEVDTFLEIAAERLEQLVRDNIQLRERTQTLQAQVDAQLAREKAVQDALVTAQELRTDMQAQSQREADHLLKEAEAEASRVLAEADSEVRNRLRGIERRLEQGQDALEDLERRRARFLQEFRGLLEREMDVVQAADVRTPPVVGAPVTRPREPRVSADAELAVDVGDLRPEPPALELLSDGSDASSESAQPKRGSPFEGIPLLETALAEAVADDDPVSSVEDIVPPAPSGLLPGELLRLDAEDIG